MGFGGPQMGGWFVMENPIEMDDWGVALFQKTTILTFHKWVSKGYLLGMQNQQLCVKEGNRFLFQNEKVHPWWFIDPC